VTRKLPKSACVATQSEGAKLHAPAAARNARVLTELVQKHAPARGRALEIASGTGQHMIAFASAMPNITWQPTDVAADRLASIDAYTSEAGLRNVAPALHLDATAPGWSDRFVPFDLVVLVNLLHLIPSNTAQTLVSQAVQSLAPGGRFILYGPFKRGGGLTSEGDARFDADLRGADPDIGYKDDEEVRAWLTSAGAGAIETAEMPANNLAFIATR